MAKRLKKARIRASSVSRFIEDVLALPFFRPRGAGRWPLCYRYEKTPSNLILVTGENATGKSLLRRLFQEGLQMNKIEAISLSMGLRTRGGIETAFIWGSEAHNATGSNSSGAILGAIETSRLRTTRHAIIWDEPDIGLSENYAAGAGEEIRSFVENPPANLMFVAVITHRRVLLERLLPLKPRHIRLGDTLTLQEALAAPVKPKSIKRLKEANLRMFRRLHKLFGI